jgi:hypothetical protein
VRQWVPPEGGEVRYEADLPACCRGYAPRSEAGFECGSCGTGWAAVSLPEPEFDAFFVDAEREGRGAA